MYQTRNASGTFRRVLCLVLASFGASVSNGLAETASPNSVVSQTPATTESARAVSNETALSPEANEVMDHLEPLWDAMRNDLASCEVELRIHFNVPPEKKLTQTALREIWDKHGLEHSEAGVSSFVKEIYGSQAVPEFPNHKIAIHGNLRRHDLGQITRLDVDSLCMIRDDANRQIRIHNRLRAPEEIPSLTLLRMPLMSREKGNRPTQVVRQDSIAQISLKNPPHVQAGIVTTTAKVDWATGIPLHYEDVTDNGPLHEILFSQLTTYSSGLTFPRLALHVIYRDGNVASMNIAQLIDARFNEPIEETRFLMSKPADYTVVDFRGEKEPLMLKVPKEQVDDLREVLNWTPQELAPITEPTIAQQPMSNTMRLLLLLNGAALIGLGIWLWKRGSLAER